MQLHKVDLYDAFLLKIHSPLGKLIFFLPMEVSLSNSLFFLGIQEVDPFTGAA